VGNINNLRSSPPPSRIPGERVSQAAQKAQNVENLKNQLKVGAAAAGIGAAAVAGMTSGPATGAMIGGMLGAAAGAILTLPNNKTYTIQAGDNLTSIAKQHLGPEATAHQIEKFINKTLDLNEDLIDNPHQIYKGDTIAVPAGPAQGQAQNIAPFLD